MDQETRTELAMLSFAEALLYDLEKYVKKEIAEGKPSSPNMWQVVVLGRVQALQKDIVDLEIQKLDATIGGRECHSDRSQEQSEAALSLQAPPSTRGVKAENKAKNSSENN